MEDHRTGTLESSQGLMKCTVPTQGREILALGKLVNRMHLLKLQREKRPLDETNSWELNTYLIIVFLVVMRDGGSFSCRL